MLLPSSPESSTEKQRETERERERERERDERTFRAPLRCIDRSIHGSIGRRERDRKELGDCSSRETQNGDGSLSLSLSLSLWSYVDLT